MYKILILISFFVFFSQEKETTIVWSESYKLTWDDFQGTPKINKEAVAVTASGITFGYSINKLDDKIVAFTTEIGAYFYPKKSWYKLEQATEHILKHEQLHFDITELFARKFRQQVTTLQLSNNLPNQLKALHKAISKEVAEYQDAYDKATNCSRNIEKQLEWEHHVKQELEKLAPYKLLQ